MASTHSSKMKRILVICSKNKWRGPTAEAIYRRDPRVQVRSAGLSPSSAHKVSVKDLYWAEQILYMEKDHLEKLRKLFPKAELPPTMDLEIADNYRFMDPELVMMLKEKIEPLLV